MKKCAQYWIIEPYHGFGLTQVDEINSGTTIHICLSYTADKTMSADALVTLVARVLAGMVFISKARNMLSSATKELMVKN